MKEIKNLKKIKKIILLITNFILYQICYLNIMTKEQENYALIINPVADLVGETQSIIWQQSIPLSPTNKKDGVLCPRIYQLLFNEIVKIIEYKGNNVVIEVPNIFYQSNLNNKKKNQFRILKKNIILLNKLKKLKIDTSKIPDPVKIEQNKENNNIITLKLPFFDKLTKKKYSAGTRFKYSSRDDDSYNAYIFNPNKLNFVLSKIPEDLCLTRSNNKNKKLQEFVKLIRIWANQTKGFIPYVWGGCSFVDIVNDLNFVEKKIILNKKKFSYYDYHSYKKNPKTGFDCSGLVVRAAQICGLPFYFKNSITIAQNLRPIEKNEKIENGDIIWLPGHIIIISDTKNNLIVEATDYSTGYGKIHEIKIDKTFNEIKNFEQLKNAFFKKQEIIRLTKARQILAIIKDFKILKLKSVYENCN